MRHQYRFLVPRLVDAGYRVVTTDLRGLGEVIGKVGVTKPPGEPLTRAEATLLGTSSSNPGTS